MVATKLSLVYASPHRLCHNRARANDVSNTEFENKTRRDSQERLEVVNACTSVYWPD